MYPDEYQHQVVNDKHQGFSLFLKVEALKDRHDVDNFLHFKKLEILKDAVKLLVAS